MREVCARYCTKLLREIMWLSVLPPAKHGTSAMDYIREVGTRSFLDTWHLVIDRAVSSGVIALLIFCVVLLVLALCREKEKARLRLKEFLQAAVVTILFFLPFWEINFALFTPHRLLSEARKATVTDLRVSVIRYGYDRETHELYSDVQYVNNGRTRRTVLGVTMCCHAKGENGERVFTNSSRPSFYAEGSTIYVEPKHPIVQSYKYKLEDSLTKLTETPGEVFGLQFVTINADGSTNVNTVEAMMVTEFQTNMFGIVSTSQNNISLDAGGYTRMEDPVITPPSPTPNKEASPH
jgi:hypothetical protein